LRRAAEAEPAISPAQPAAREAARKAIHAAAGTAAALVAWFLPPLPARALLAAAALFALAMDLIRLRVPAADRRFRLAVGAMLRPAERRGLTGATMLALGAALTALIFPGRVAAVGILYAAIGDASAALVGSRLGRRTYRPGRTVEGTLAFFAAALAVGYAAPGTGLPAAAAAALAVTLVEAAPVPIDDNVTIPVAGAAAYRLAIWLAG
jgi:dolichol kinase